MALSHSSAAKALSSLLKKRAHAGNTNAKNGWTTQAVHSQQWRSSKIPVGEWRVQVSGARVSPPSG
jgi:hypothetical protein